ncbi:hypothetical protein TpMuguga_04g00617 [Theileria parva strain Muguga]|uniref:Uncharacterized protein n=1 Tax=Theileria parva TaxID=5875 RepID=Q4N1W0_THEPA|nr:uncharacterized protein TpMuguga_04g00617 [Theileria parva strain Muguga]EAN31969.1 hypothetical protein TpMuguga_04g00617 [Theileria parva strain Muguga]|eukprot:XP_764252.1 hypothetical protein [Theileria parva strain Muguga]
MSSSKTQRRRLSPRLIGKKQPNYSDLSTSVSLNTCESSTSTCDSINSKRNLPQSNKRLNYSIKNDDYLNSDTESDDIPPSTENVVKDPNICRRCDQLTAELTQLRIQSFDKWVSEIKSLQDMLIMKESIIEDFNSKWSGKERDLRRLKADLTNAQKTISQLQNDINYLKSDNDFKNTRIEELEYMIEGKNDKISQQKKIIEKMEKMAREDSKIIKRLRV